MIKQYCYNCGIELDKKNTTREHIPAKNLFEGYDANFKENRITVSACISCNSQYSPSDEEFRNMIGIIAKNNANHKITEKSIRSILRKDSRGNRLEISSFGKVTGVSFNNIPIEDYHKKNFKGLFYFQYSKPLTNDYILYVNIDENDWSDFVLGIIGYLKEFFIWKYSGHPDVLRYVIQPFRLNVENPSKADLIPIENENMYVGFFDYNNEHSALVLAIRKNYMDEIKQLQ